VLATDVPDFEVHVGKSYGRYILPNGWDRLEFGIRVRREEDGFDLLVKGGLASIIEAEKEDRVF
jgi:hypothetical protein